MNMNFTTIMGNKDIKEINRMAYKYLESFESGDLGRHETIYKKVIIDILKSIIEDAESNYNYVLRLENIKKEITINTIKNQLNNL